MEHHDDHQILACYQHGFHQKQSTEPQLTTTLEKDVRSFDNNQQTDIRILDFSKAFHGVAHQRLLRKLEYHGICDKTRGWIKTWLTT